MKIPIGTVIFREGDASDVAYVIQEGKVEIFRMDGEGRHLQIALLGAGQMFGEIGPMDGLPRNASARAVKDSVLLPVALDNAQ